MIPRSLILVCAWSVSLSCGMQPDGEAFRVLVFTKTAGFRHASIDAGVALIHTLGASNGFDVEVSDRAEAFTPANLCRYRAVVWLNTTGDVLNDGQQAAYESFIRSGGGWVGVHAAADCEYDWPWYGELIGGGAWFASHPAIQTATLNVDDAAHASSRDLPAAFDFEDEWYNFRANSRAAATVLLTIDEQTYDAGVGAMGEDHPIAWYHEYDGGRAWYTAWGHREATYTDARFASHLLGGIRWAGSMEQ